MSTLFDELMRGGAAAVRALVGRHETLELDFKQRATSEKENKKILGKALSAFSNSMGGVIVWGVDCRKDADGVDEVIGFVPIEGLSKFASDMRDWTVEAVMPRLAKVRVHALEEGGDRGFLVVDVPRSERRPHQSEFGDKYYYRRAGASSRRMEHFEIEDAFKRQSAPELSLEYGFGSGSYRYGGNGPTEVTLILKFSLRNNSHTSARNAYLATFEIHSTHSHLLHSNNITVRSQPPRRFFEADPGLIHPDVSRLMAALEIRVLLLKSDSGWLLPRNEVEAIAKTMVIAYGCLDLPMKTAEVRLTEAEILAAIPLQNVKVLEPS